MALRRFALLAHTAALCGLLSGCAASGFGWRGPDQAHKLNGNSLAQAPARPSIGSSLASALTIKPRVDEAEDPIKLTSKQESVGAEVYISAARMYENRGEADAAAGQYRKALEVSPKSLAALVGYARLQDRQGKFEEANKYYKKAIAAHPKSATAHNDHSLCLARSGQHENALVSLERAVSLEPANKLYRNNIAAILVDLERPKDAFEHLVLAHGEAIAHYNLGYLFYQRNRAELASEQFALAIEKDPSLTPAHDMLQRSGGIAQQPDAVRRTQHVAESPTVKVSEPFTSPPDQIAPPAAAAPTKQATKKPATRKPVFKSLSEKVQSIVEPQPAETEISASQIPQTVFPPIRLPAVPTADEDAKALPAPLPLDDGATALSAAETE